MEKTIAIFKRILRHELLSGTIYLFIGGIIANFIAFIFNLFMARNLSYSDYGVFASLLSVITLGVIPSQSLTSIIVRFATDFFAREEYGKAHFLYRRMTFFWLILGLIIFGVVAILSPRISSFLHINNNLLVMLTGVSIALSYVSIVNLSFLQSLLKFKYLAFSYVAGSIVKIISGIILVILGFSVGGALWALVAMITVIYILSFYPLKFLPEKRHLKEISINWREIIRYALPTTVTILSFTSFITTDVILVKHYFSSTDAGLYGGISLMGKVIFYFTAPIPSVMFPLIVKRHARGENFREFFYLSLILVAIPSFAITAFYFLFPQFSIQFFLGGGQYLKIAPFLGIFGLLIFTYSLLNVVVNFFLSIKKTKIVFLCIGVSILQLFLIAAFHSNFYQIILISLFSTSLLLISLLLYYTKQYGFYNSPK